MERLISYIQQNPVTVVCIASALIFIAGLAVRKFRVLSLVFVLIAAFAFYTILKENRRGRFELNDIKNDVKSEVEQIKKDVKSEVIKKIK